MKAIRSFGICEIIKGVEVPSESEALRLLDAERKRIERNIGSDYDNNIRRLVELDDKINSLLRR